MEESKAKIRTVNQVWHTFRGIIDLITCCSFPCSKTIQNRSQTPNVSVSIFDVYDDSLQLLKEFQALLITKTTC